VFSNRILFEGPAFAGCAFIDDIFQRCTLRENHREQDPCPQPAL
jgi:hypothetical protein